MNKKINLVIILVSLTLVVLGFVYLYSNILFYKQSAKTKATITYIGRPESCYGSNKGCYWTQKVSFTFNDKNMVLIKNSQEIFTPTLVSGLFATGNVVQVLYKLKPNTAELLDRLVPNLGPPVYDIKIYTYHYWVYPILTVVFGILIYFIGKKKLKDSPDALGMTPSSDSR